MIGLAAGLVSAALTATSPVYSERLDNGVTLLVDCDRTAPVIAVQAWAHVGSADENNRLCGAAHMVEHMMFKGTTRRGVGDVARDIEAAGGEINAWTSFDETVYHVVASSGDFTGAVDVLADALGHSVFDRDELEREREVLLEELRQNRDDPARTVAQTLFSTAFARHPYGRPIIGSERSIARLDRSDLRAFVDRFYTADNLAVIVAGDVDVDTARRVVERGFRGLRRGDPRRARVKEPRQTTPRAAVVKHEGSEARLAIGFPAPGLRHPHTGLLDLAAVALGQGASSRLERQLVRGDERVRSAHSHVHSLRDAGLFVTTVFAAPHRLMDTARAALEQIFVLASAPLDSDELAKAKRILEADDVFQRETAEGRARVLGIHLSQAGDAKARLDYLDVVKRATGEQVRRAAARYLRGEVANIVALMPREHRASGGRRRVAVENKLAATALQMAPAAAPVVNAALQAGDVIRDVLPNGTKVLIKRDDSVPLVAVRVLWSGGVRLETPATNGTNHLLARLVTSGCGDRTADELAAAVDSIAGSIGGISGRNAFGLRGEWMAEDWQRGLEIMTDCILRPAWDDSAFHRERRRAIEAAEARDASASQRAFRAMLEELFHSHPYRFDTRGSSASLAALTPTKVRRYFDKHYPPSAAVVAIAGNLDPEAALRFLRSRFDGASRRVRAKRTAAGRTPSISNGPRQVFQYLDREQAYLVIGFPGASLHEPDRRALEVLVAILSGQGGRLFVQLRDHLGLAYQLGALSVEGIDPGFAAVYLSCKPEKVTEAYQALRSELEMLAADGVSDEEVARAKKYLVGTHGISLQRRASVAAALAFHEAHGLGYDDYLRYAVEIEAISKEDVARAARRYFDWGSAVVSTVIPPSFSPEVERRARGTRRRRRKKTR